MRMLQSSFDGSPAWMFRQVVGGEAATVIAWGAGDNV